ncbi:MAG: PAS domain S-box protein [Cyanobacteria bacterium P01_H01_bin.121]
MSFFKRRSNESDGFPLRGLLITPFVLQIIVAVTAVGALSFRSGQQAVNNLAAQLQTEIATRITQQLQSYVAIPHNVNQINANALAQGDITIPQPNGTHVFWQQAKIYPNTNLIYCGSEQDGSFLGVGRNIEDRSLQMVVYNQASQRVGNYYALDNQGNPGQLLRAGTNPYDARIRPWYEAALAANGPTWSDIYLDFDTRLPTITASLPVYGADGEQVLGVCATDFILPAEMSQFLRTLEIGETGVTFIMDRDGALVSSSVTEPLLTEQGDTVQQVKAKESQDPLIQGTATYLQQEFGALTKIQQSRQFSFRLQGQRQYVEVSPFKDSEGLDWLIVVVIPAVDFMAQINASARNTVLLCLVALAIAILTGIATARRITKPILSLNTAAQDFADGNLTRHVEVHGSREIQTLGQSFNTMAQQLHQSFADLETKNQVITAAEATNRALILSIPDLLIRMRSDGTYLDILSSDRLQVYDRPNFQIGSTVYDSLPIVNADLRLHYVRAALNTHTVQVYEQSLVINDTVQHEEIRIIAISDTEVLVMVRDITKRKQAEEALRIAEEKYRSIFENALEGIFQSTPDGHFLSVNPAMAELHGYDSPKDMVASVRDIETQIYADAQDHAQFQHQIAIANEVKDFEYQAKCKDGRIVWVHENARAVRDDRGNLLYYEGIVQDITLRKHQEAELRRQLKELQIGIDQTKREQEVATVTQSDYFQEVREMVDNIQLDQFWS